MNYEEKYKQALEKAREQYNKRTPLYDIEIIFPELNETEDERIRKAILQFFESQDDNTTYSLVPKKDILVWLEKQSKKLDAEKVIEWLDNNQPSVKLVAQFKHDFDL